LPRPNAELAIPYVGIQDWDFKGAWAFPAEV
jgi:hypothetical protein